MIITLKRIAHTPEGVFGVLMHEGHPFALTAERPWLNNARSISCIPPGTYTCSRNQSPKFGEGWLVRDVPNRSHILIHKGNIPTQDSHGCILVGEIFDLLNGKAAVLSSKQAFNQLMDKTDKIDVFTLDIVSL